MLRNIKNYNPPRKAFTLTELLVVVAIILLLVLLAFPALRRSIESSNEAKCVGNLRQLISGWSLYCADHDLNSVNYSEFPANLYSGWPANLSPYMGNGNIDRYLICPSASKEAPNSNNGRGGTSNAWRSYGSKGRKFLCSYGINANWYNGRESFYDPVVWESVKNIMWVKNVHESPNNIVVFSDATWVDFSRGSIPTMEGIKTGNGWQIARHKNKGINMAFAGGHVRFVTIGEAWESVRFNKTDVVPRSTSTIPAQYR